MNSRQAAGFAVRRPPLATPDGQTFPASSAVLAARALAAEAFSERRGR
jgi:hypothetical protein